jgi:hypothetical protein
MLVIGCLLVAVAAYYFFRARTADSGQTAAQRARPARDAAWGSASFAGSGAGAPGGARHGQTAEQIVADKVKRFGESRLAIEEQIARGLHRDVPMEIKRFFDAIEAGDWDQIKAQFHELAVHSSQYEYSKDHWPELDPFWPALLDAYGVAEQAHAWPAQQLLDYGQAVLNSLQPGMVYVGGTDNGRWIPELLNETSGGEPHMMITQNALADSRYVDYLNTLYGGQLTALTPTDLQQAFQDYTADAQKRLAHDQQFPDEPKQVRPGENLVNADGTFQISGQSAVMAINARLLDTLMQKNPGLSFAMEESFPMTGTYANAVPLGPLMELNVPDAQTAFNADVASQSLGYWQATADNILADPVASASDATLKSYAHDAVAAANLLAAHNYSDDARQTYEIASQLWPGSGEAAFGLAQLLARNGQNDAALQVLDNFARSNPDQASAVQSVRSQITAAPPVARTP